jgi:hypothetical protein
LGLIFSDDLIRLSAFMLSEMVFMAMVAACLLALQRAQATSSVGYYCLGGMILGLATLTRHAGLFFLPPTLCWAYLSSREKGRTRLLPCAGYLLSALIPLIASKLILPPPGHRTILLHWPGSEHWNSLGVAFASWLLPYRLAFPWLGWLIAIVALLFCFKLVLGKLPAPASPASNEKNPLEELLSLLAFTALGYLGMLFITVALVYFNTPFDYRLLFPAHVLLLMMLIIGLASPRPLRPWTSGVILLCLLAWCGGQTVRGAKTSQQISTQGIGITSKRYLNSVALHYARNLPGTVELVSNKPDYIEELLHRPGVQFPRRNEEFTMLPRPEFRDELEQLKAKLATSKAVVVWFVEPPRAFLPEQKEFEQFLALRRLDASDQTAILYVSVNAHF